MQKSTRYVADPLSERDPVVSGAPVDESLYCSWQIDPYRRRKVAPCEFSTRRLPSGVTMGELNQLKPQTGQLPGALQGITLG